MNKYDEYSVVPQLINEIRKDVEVESRRKEVLYYMFSRGEIPVVEYYRKSKYLERLINDMMDFMVTTGFDYMFNSD